MPFEYRAAPRLPRMAMPSAPPSSELVSDNADAAQNFQVPKPSFIPEIIEFYTFVASFSGRR